MQGTVPGTYCRGVAVAGGTQTEAKSRSAPLGCSLVIPTSAEEQAAFEAAAAYIVCIT